MVGDIHGCLDTFASLLQRQGLVDGERRWIGGTTELWIIGDLADRGPEGLASIELVMSLQHRAAESGGQVNCLMGNHDAFLVAARRFLDTPLEGAGLSFIQLWAMNGGRPDDLERLNADHLAWLSQLPLAARVGDALLVHADSEFYLDLGGTLDEINAAGRDIVMSDDISRWSWFVTSFVRRNELWDTTGDGAESLDRLLGAFGCERVIHGHTPIPLVTGADGPSVTEPLVYSSDRCVNVDGGMFLGSPGFAYRLDHHRQ